MENNEDKTAQKPVDEIQAQAGRIINAYYSILIATPTFYVVYEELIKKSVQNKVDFTTTINSRILKMAKECALIAIDEKIKSIQLQRELYAPIAAWSTNEHIVSEKMQEVCVSHISDIGKLKAAIENYEADLSLFEK